jgi:tetratricopeptide (TPR) repeat protein
VTLAVAAATFADAQQVTDGWTTVRSANFSLSGNARPDQLRSMAARLEEFRWSFSQLYPQVRLEKIRATQFVIFKDAAAYFDFLPRRPDGSTDLGVAGYFQAGEDVNYITLAAAANQIDPASTVVHEYFHSIVDAAFNRTTFPPWLNEGLAEYFETVRVVDNRRIVTGGQQPEHLRLLRRSALIPLSQFFSTSAADLKAMSPDSRRLYYAQAWAVVDALIRSGQLSLSSIDDTIAEFSPGDVPTDGLAASYEKLDRALVQNVRGTFPQPSSVEARSDVPASFVPEAAPVSAARASYLLGDLLLHTGELARSESFLRQALADNSSDPEVNGSLGVLLVRQEKPAEAKPFLQRAVAGGNRNFLIHFSLAYAALNDHMSDGSLTEIPREAADNIKGILRRAIELGPDFSESYRLSALIDFVRDENLDEAVALLQKGLSIKSSDTEMKLLLARILLRREDVGRARQIAEQVAATTSDAKRKAEADEIVKTVFDYSQAKSAAAVPAKLNITVSDQQGLVVLKRSWLTDEDVARIDRERENNNYNRIIIRPVTGEQQLVGRIEKISCAGGPIVFRARTVDGLVISLSSPDFAGIRMTVAKEGNNSFQIGCGVDLQSTTAVINYRPNAVAAAGRTAGQLTALSFVSDDFRLKSIEDMSAARLVAIDDDTLRRSGPRPVITPETIRQSIEASLRKPAKDEDRLVGNVERIECSASEVDFRVSSGGKSYTFARPIPGRIDMGWFTVASSQLRVACGSGPLISRAIFTFSRSSRFPAADGELRAVEFIPDGFIP